MRSAKTTFIATVFNEANTIDAFIDSVLTQTQKPDEIVIVDGGSSDTTVLKIKMKIAKLKTKKIKLFIKPGNRSVGRNEAIRRAIGTIILCSDSGNTLDANWAKNILRPFKDKKVEVVAGYYEGRAMNAFQKCIIPYALVMPDQVDPKHFLPATRSVAFKKSIWKKVKGFDEGFSHNEDYVFANKLISAKINIFFAKDAIVYWQPRNTLKEFYIMISRFAFGDAESGLYRPRVLLLFARYILGLFILFLALLYNSIPVTILLSIGFIVYLLYSIQKNYRYVLDKRAYIYLPLLQLTADNAVLSGTTFGTMKRLIKRYSTT